MLIKSLCYIKENVNKEPFIHSVYTQLYEGSMTTPKGCIQFQIPAATVARRRSCIGTETIMQHTSRMASNDTTRYGYKLGLYDNEKKNLYEC